MSTTTTRPVLIVGGAADATAEASRRQLGDYDWLHVQRAEDLAPAPYGCGFVLVGDAKRNGLTSQMWSALDRVGARNLNPPVRIGDTIEPTDDFDRFKVGTKLGCLTALGAATRSELGWVMTGTPPDHVEEVLSRHRWRVFDLPSGGAA